MRNSNSSRHGGRRALFDCTLWCAGANPSRRRRPDHRCSGGRSDREFPYSQSSGLDSTHRVGSRLDRHPRAGQQAASASRSRSVRREGVWNHGSRRQRTVAPVRLRHLSAEAEHGVAEDSLADIFATDVSGTFYSVSGTIHLRGSATSIDAESMNGSVDVDVAAPWVHARTGQGHLLIRGTPQDVDGSTIGGTLDVASPSILRDDSLRCRATSTTSGRRPPAGYSSSPITAARSISCFHRQCPRSWSFQRRRPHRKRLRASATGRVRSAFAAAPSRPRRLADHGADVQGCHPPPPRVIMFDLGRDLRFGTTKLASHTRAHRSRGAVDRRGHRRDDFGLQHRRRRTLSAAAARPSGAARGTLHHASTADRAAGARAVVVGALPTARSAVTSFEHVAAFSQSVLAPHE